MDQLACQLRDFQMNQLRFEILAPELQLQILGTMSRTKAWAAIHACPTLYRLSQRYHHALIRNHTFNDLAGMLDDALALVTFPEFGIDDMAMLTSIPPQNEDDTPLLLSKRSVLTDDHLKKWAAGDFPNPFETNDWPMIERLDRLCHCVWRYVDDFLMKATSSHLPTAYRVIPDGSHNDHFGSALQNQLRQSPVVNHAFDVDQLTPSQRQRIFQAFIRYEILCKVHCPIGGPPPDPAAPTAAQAFKLNPVGVRDKFSDFNWRLFDEYANRYAADEPVSDQEIVDIEMLMMVREYIQLTCEALIANTAQLPLPANIRPNPFHKPEFEHAPSIGPNFITNTTMTRLLGPSVPFGVLGTDSTFADYVICVMATGGLCLLNNLLSHGQPATIAFLNRIAEDIQFDDGSFGTITHYTGENSVRVTHQLQYPGGLYRLYQQRAEPLFRNHPFDSGQILVFPNAPELRPTLDYLPGLQEWSNMVSDDSKTSMDSFKRLNAQRTRGAAAVEYITAISHIVAAGHNQMWLTFRAMAPFWEF